MITNAVPVLKVRDVAASISWYHEMLGFSEFEITDPDGHALCLSEQLQGDGDLPTPEG